MSPSDSNTSTEIEIRQLSDGGEEQEGDESFAYFRHADQRPSEALREEIDDMMQNLPDTEFTQRLFDQLADQYKAETDVEECAANLDISMSLIRSTKSFIHIYTAMILQTKRAAKCNAKNGGERVVDTDLREYVKRLRRYKHQLLVLRSRRKKMQQECKLAIRHLESSIRHSL